VGKTNARDKGLQEKKETNQRFNHLKKKNPQTTPLPFYTLGKKSEKI
jgi:hypothetical protein